MASRFTGCCKSVLSSVPDNCWAQCGDCKFCPPNCCTCIEYHFEVTDSQVSLYNSSLYPLQQNKSVFKLPDFSSPEAVWDGAKFQFGESFLFGYGGTCSFPCVTVPVVVTVCHHCCIYNKSLAVGAGNVTATASPSIIDCCKIRLKPKINGFDPPVYVSDGGSIDVTLETESIGDGCPCTVNFKQIVDPCEPYGTPLYLYRRDTSGKVRVSINTYEALQQNIHKQKLELLRRNALIRRQKKR